MNQAKPTPEDFEIAIKLMQRLRNPRTASALMRIVFSCFKSEGKDHKMLWTRMVLDASRNRTVSDVDTDDDVDRVADSTLDNQRGIPNSADEKTEDVEVD